MVDVDFNVGVTSAKLKNLGGKPRKMEATLVAKEALIKMRRFTFTSFTPQIWS